MGNVGGVVTDDPAVIGAEVVEIAVGGPAGIDHPVDQGQGASFLVGSGNEGNRRVFGIDRLDDRGAVELLRAGGEVHRVELLQEVGDAPADGFRHGHEIHGAGRGVDDRGVGDADLGGDLGAAVDVRLGHRHGDAADVAVVPVGHSRRIGVEGVGAVMLGHDKNHVVGAAADGEIGHIEGLGIDLPVHGVGEELAEGRAVDVGGCQDGFVLVPSVAGLVIMVGRQGNLGQGRRGGKGEEYS